MTVINLMRSFIYGGLTVIFTKSMSNVRSQLFLVKAYTIIIKGPENQLLTIFFNGSKSFSHSQLIGT